VERSKVGRALQIRFSRPATRTNSYRHAVCCSRSPTFILELSSLGFRDALCILFVGEESCVLIGTMNDNKRAAGEQSLRETIAEIMPAKREQLARIVSLKKLCRFRRVVGAVRISTVEILDPDSGWHMMS
jgi:hypothetical protein